MSKVHPNFIAAGYISGAHGIRGEIILVSQINDIDLLESTLDAGLILFKDGQTKSIAVDEIRPHKESFLIKSGDIPDRTAAEKLKGHSWIIPREKMTSAPNENIFLHEIEGFKVSDSHLGDIGTIEGFSSNGSQDLLEVRTASGRASIPLVKAFLVKIDFNAKTVFMNLPDGLIAPASHKDE